MTEKIITVDNTEQLSELFGQLDGNIGRIKKQYNVNIVSRDGDVKIIGDEQSVSDAQKSCTGSSENQRKRSASQRTDYKICHLNGR